MSNFILKIEESSYAFLNIIFYKGDGVFCISDSTDEYIIVSELNNPNNKVSFSNQHYVEFARYLKENEAIYGQSKFLNLPLFHNFIQ